MTLTQAVKLRIEQLLSQMDDGLYTITRIGGVSPNTVKELMAERNKSVNLKTVMQIIRAFGISAGEFFGNNRRDYRFILFSQV